jgi:hypothetical protein
MADRFTQDVRPDTGRGVGVEEWLTTTWNRAEFDGTEPLEVTTRTGAKATVPAWQAALVFRDFRSTRGSSKAYDATVAPTLVEFTDGLRASFGGPSHVVVKRGDVLVPLGAPRRAPPPSAITSGGGSAPTIRAIASGTSKAADYVIDQVAQQWVSGNKTILATTPDLVTNFYFSLLHNLVFPLGQATSAASQTLGSSSRGGGRRREGVGG